MTAGMRWYTCDLHVHTPGDINWTGPGRPTPSPGEESIQESARVYLRRCHELGLEVIGVTDHNFIRETDHRKWFLTHLIEQNDTVSQEVKKPPLVIFPGFEVDIGYHVLCLFEPVKKGKDLSFLSELITQWGLPIGNRFDGRNVEKLRRDGHFFPLQKILAQVQGPKAEHPGIVIAAHAFSDSGICDKNSSFKKDYIENHDLLAVEVPSFPLSDHAKSILIDNRDPNWKRGNDIPSPAAILSSDAKALGNDIPQANQLGYRTTRIKMSKPSIESLRQAFIDHPSRIHLSPEPPPHPATWISSIAIIGNKFLSDLTIELNPCLTCIIGGRGSGKSLLVESLRLALRGEQQRPIGLKGKLQENEEEQNQITRVKSSFNQTGRITAIVTTQGQVDCLCWNQDKGISEIQNRPVQDQSVIFQSIKAHFLSQEELTERSKTAQQFATFLDSLVSEGVQFQRRESRSLVESLAMARQQRERIARLEGEAKTLGQETQELERQLHSFQVVQGDLRRHRGAQDAKRWYERIKQNVGETQASLEHILEDLDDQVPTLGSALAAMPDQTLVTRLEQDFQSSFAQLQEELRGVLTKFVQHIQTLDAGETLDQFVNQTQQTLTLACQANAIAADQVERLRDVQQQVVANQKALEAKRQEIVEEKRKPHNPNLVLEQLTKCWYTLYKVRAQAIDTILESSSMIRIGNNTPILQINMSFAKDIQSFKESWSSLRPKGTTKAGRDWDSIATAVFNGFHAIKIDLIPAFGNPYHWLESILDQDTAPTGIDPILSVYWSDLKTARSDKASDWQRLLGEPIQDSMDLILYRHDGTEAGQLSNNLLSTGQRNTALLALLLAQDSGPLVIDQPEDEIDAQFIFKELVPLLRKAKSQRQIILVTHNANLPVNADAELVIALDARQGRGEITCHNGMDDPDVTQAILDIMEGSKQAFENRRQKYGF